MWLGLGLAAAWAAPTWTAEPARPLLDGAFVDVAVGRIGGVPVVLGLGASSSTLWTDSGTVSVPVGGTRAVFLPASGDQPTDLVVCGPSGVQLRLASGFPFAASEQLSTVPCRDVAVLGQTVVVLTDEGLVALEGNERSTSRMLIPAVNATSMAVAEGRAGVLVDGELRIRERGEVRVEPAPEHAVHLAADEAGWMIAVGGETPHILRADGSTLQLPAVPSHLRAASVHGEGGHLGAVGEQLIVGLRGQPLVLQPAVSLQGAVMADLAEDGCADVVGRTSTGMVVLDGRCAEELPEIPPVPSALTVTSSWTSLALEVGDAVVMQLTREEEPSSTYYLRGGSPRMSLTPEGLFTFSPTNEDVGLWRTGIQVRTADSDLWTGIVVRVVGDEATQPIRTLLPPVAPDRLRPPPGPWTIRQCLLTVGAHGGLSQNKRTEWSAVGLPDVVASGSPAILASCSGGGDKVRWVFGADTAPAFFTLSTSGRAAHLIGGTLGLELGSETVRAGPIVNTGLLFFAVGGRLLVLPFETQREARHGFELRVLGHPTGVAASAMLGYTVEFGRF